VRIAEEKVKVYTEMDFGVPSDLELVSGDEVEFVNVRKHSKNEWAEIVLRDGKHAYIQGDAQLFQIVSASLCQNQVAVYTEASAHSSIKYHYEKGTEFDVIDDISDGGKEWLRVRDVSGREGFIGAETEIEEKDNQDVPSPLGAGTAERNTVVCAKLLGSNKSSERLLVFTKDRVVELMLNPVEVKPGGRFHPQKKATHITWLIISGALFGALGGLFFGAGDVGDDLTARSNRVAYLVAQSLSVMLAEYPEHIEILYSQVKQLIWAKGSRWSGQSLSILVSDGTRRDYAVTWLPKEGDLEQALAYTLGSRFERRKK
jgi:hypothetical protein